MYRLEAPFTWDISSGVLIINALLFRSVMTASTAILIPLRKSITLAPAAIDLQPSVSIAWVKTVAQVVPAMKYKHMNLLPKSKEDENFVIQNVTITIQLSFAANTQF